MSINTPTIRTVFLNLRRKGSHRLIEFVENDTDRVFLFRPYLSPDEKCHEHRRQGHGKKGGEEHSEGLCVCQWFEKPPGLGLEGKNGQESNGNNKQSEKERWPHFFCRFDDHINPVWVEFGVRSSVFGVF